MPIPLNYTEIEALFTSLGIASFDAALPEGKIRWLDGDGKIVAAGRCQAILSWTGANDSLMWASAIPAFIETSVPCLPPPDAETYQDGVGEIEAEALARQSAQLTGAQFLYAAATGPESKLFLAIRDFREV
ncbi:MAG: hypothetical protein ACI8S6_006062 [Myxococcota bacterium]|jgi:hypothetical protein